MANINDTIDMITNESLRILHQKLNHVTNIVTEYDDSYAQSGAKIGDALRIRLPLQYQTGTGATMATGTGADSIATSTTLTVSTQRHVPLRFTSEEMTMDIDYLQQRHLEPAMAKLAAIIENDTFGMLNQIGNAVDAGTKITFEDIMAGRQELMDNLAPINDRCAILDTRGNRDLVVDNKALFNDQREIGEQYKEGAMGYFAGFDFYENTLLPKHTSGAEGGGTAYRTNGAGQEKTLTASDNDPTQWTGLVVDTGTNSILAGDVITIGGVFDVHPETKETTGVLKQFSVTADQTGAGTLSLAPALVGSGPHQNASNAAGDGEVVTVIGAASTLYNQSLLFQKGYAAFATADLLMPEGTHFASRQVYDGISMRIVGDYDILKDRFLIRADVLYGYKVLRPELACKLWHT